MTTSDNDNAALLENIVLHPDFGDVGQMFNMRAWLQKAIENAGAKMVGGGIGMGEADIDVELEGHLFNLNIRPIVKADGAPRT